MGGDKTNFCALYIARPVKKTQRRLPWLNDPVPLAISSKKLAVLLIEEWHRWSDAEEKYWGLVRNDVGEIKSTHVCRPTLDRHFLSGAWLNVNNITQALL